jgi:type VI secretion system secreted protein Hcp
VAQDWFLKIDGIDGESQVDGHKGEIEVESWSWGVVHEGAPGPGGGGASGKPTFHDFHFVANISKASPKLFLSCATGVHHKDALLTGRRAGAKTSEFLKYKLTDVQVSGVQHGGGSGQDMATEQFSLRYGRFDISYTAQKADGSAGAPVTAGYDLKTSKKV